MYGNNFNPFMYQPYYQSSNLSRSLGGLASYGMRNSMGTGLSNAALAGSNKVGALGLGKSLLGKFSFSGFLNGASKTLNVVNQAIPIFYQVKPMFSNAKTMLRIMGAVKDEESSNKNSSRRTINSNYSKQQTVTNKNSNSNLYNNTTRSNATSSFVEENPTFFI